MKTLNDRFVVLDEKPRRGGMAEIVRAIDTHDAQQSHVAIKFFPQQIDQDPHHLEAYSREAKILERLSHPNIVRLIDGGRDEESGRRFIVLEWLESSLSDLLKSRPIRNWEEFHEQIGAPILAALGYAFGKEVIHRDLKPGNVLFSKDNVLKVADFGISKLRTLAAPGLTLAGFKSIPFAPEIEDDRAGAAETRDVFGFAALTLACFHQKPLVNYADLQEALDTFNGPPEIRPILKRALSADATDRQRSILALAEALESARPKVNQARAPEHTVSLRLSRAAEQNLQQAIGRQENLSRFVIEDLLDQPALKVNQVSLAPRESAVARAIQLTLLGSQFSYSLSVDEPARANLVVTKALRLQPSVLDLQRESAWKPRVRWVMQAGNLLRSDGAETIQWLVASVAEFEAEQSQRRQHDRAEKLFKTWSSLLQAKSDLERSREASIEYHDIEAVGHRLKLVTRGPLDPSLIGQCRIIELSETRYVAGEIESIGPGLVVLWTDKEPKNLPRRGSLQFDTRASRIAIQRQRQALDAIRFGRAARVELRELLLDPTAARIPTPPDAMTFVQAGLDESKRSAVASAIGSDSFLVVEGPPGTGKTRFIAELVLQTLRREPRARVLLTSQTHVALDNALEAIRQLDRDLRLVRIGNREDDRVSGAVRDLLLENRVDVWLHDVQRKSEKFIKEYGARLNIDADEIELGMSAGRVRAALEELQAVTTQTESVSKEIEVLVARSAESPPAEGSDTNHETKETLRERREALELKEVERDRCKSRVKSAREALTQLPGFGKELAKASVKDLAEWEEGLLNRGPNSKRMHEVLRLTEDWHLRFGRSREFYGALLADAQLIAGTCIGFANVPGMNTIEFDLCIVDEASKASTTELLVPLSRAKRWVLVGDRHQLPPFIEDGLDDPQALENLNLTKEDLRATLLETLSDQLPGECVVHLTHQHRMVRQIGDLVSQCFYGGRLKSVVEGDPTSLAPALSRPVVWVSTSRLRDCREKSDQQSFKNLAECNEVITLLGRLSFMAKSKRKKYSVAVLTGYAAQREELGRRIDGDFQRLEDLDIECNTVDAFQGREADIAIYSVTRSNERGDLGFLRDRRRLNVALSRAKIGLAIVGDLNFARSAKGENPWLRVLQHIDSHPNDCSIQVVEP